MKMYEWSVVQRSGSEVPNDSGMASGLCQIMHWRRYHPSSRSASASVQGRPIRSLGLMCPILGVPVTDSEPGFDLCLSDPPGPLPDPACESSISTHSVPSGFNTLRHSWNTHVKVSTYSAGEDSRPICPSTK